MSAYPGQLRTRAQVRTIVAVAVVAGTFLGGITYGERYERAHGQHSTPSVPPPGMITCSLPGAACVQLQLDNPDYEVLTPTPRPTQTGA